MKQMIYVLAAAFLLSPALYSQTAEELELVPKTSWLSLSLETSVGFFYGTMSEFVYEDDRVLAALTGRNILFPMSRLDWKLMLKTSCSIFPFYPSCPPRVGL